MKQYEDEGRGMAEKGRGDLRGTKETHDTVSHVLVDSSSMFAHDLSHNMHI